MAALALITASCEQEDISPQEKVYTYKFEPVDLIQLKYNSKVLLNTINEEIPNLILSSKFETNIKIPDDILSTGDVQLFEDFLNKNKNKIDGKITFYFNGIEDESFIINRQNLYLLLPKINDYPRRDECSVEGVRQCVQYNIYEGMNTFEKIVCSFAGFACIAEEAASCTSRNCLDDRAPND